MMRSVKKKRIRNVGPDSKINPLLKKDRYRIFYVPERSFMQLTVSCSGRGEGGGGSSPVMLLKRTGGVV
jgi:hypothetical protein